MSDNETLKYVLKVWATTIIFGSILTFSILTTLTTFASEIKNLIDLVRISFTVTFIATLLTIPVTLIFYILADTLVRKKLTNTFIKGVLVFIAAVLIFIFFVFVFEQGTDFLWTYSSTAIFFYCYFSVLTVSIIVYKLNRVSKV